MVSRRVLAVKFTAVVPLVLACAVALLVAPASADLLSYVEKPEPAFAWELKGKTVHPEGTVYDLHLVSQVWQGIQWEHQLQVYQPKGTAPHSTLLLMNTGGTAGEDAIAFGMQLASAINAPCAVIYHIPNQPLLGGKTEDTLITETFVRYLNTKDENWPLLFPMAKSVVKAMDALQAFSEQEWKKSVTRFIVTGGSKRGWTSWLTAVADPRVKAIVPLVIDTLNMRKQMPHQLESFGTYSEQIADYTKRGLVPMRNTPDENRLWSMVDPYTYRDRLTLPKLLVNGNNDPYWAVDALNLYWDGLKGDKWVLYVPNAGHGLEQRHEDGSSDRKRALSGIAAFVRHQIADKPMPTLHWKHDDANGKLRLTVQAAPPPLGARLWVAKSPTRDFRQSQWVEQAVSVRGGSVVGMVAPPEDGYLVFYAEVDYKIDDLPYHLSTQLRVVGKSGRKPSQ